jgi:DNA-binding NtrC family response regulator
VSELLALVVDDDADFRDSLSLLVEREGFRVLAAGSVAAAREILEEASPGVVVVDLSLPDGSGLDLREAAGDAEIVVVTGNATVGTAVEALREGVSDYLTKPVDRNRLRGVLAHVARAQELKGEVESLRDELKRLGRFGPLIGRSEPMQEVYRLVSKVAPTDATVLVTGESGTGKEVVARCIHARSRRAKGPFVAINCGAVSEGVIESELFGHEKGAFTGADRRREGVFERASGGTLLLDEITEMPLDLQVKLLRVLETRSVRRVGSVDPVEVDVRIVAATNRDPEQAISQGTLREDLYYRLAVFVIPLPPLRERRSDVELLVKHFLEEFDSEREGERRFTSEAIALLERHDWPGNVRELRNVVQRAAILAEADIGPDALSGLDGSAGPSHSTEPGSSDGSLTIRPGTPIAEAEKRLILATLDSYGGDKKTAARRLGISLKTLYNRLKLYDAQESD